MSNIIARGMANTAQNVAEEVDAKIEALADVAVSGDYDDLLNKPEVKVEGETLYIIER